MKMPQAKQTVYDIVSMFFQGATVVFADQSRRAKPNLPLVVINFGHTHRVQHPPTVVLDGHLVSYYPTFLMVQVDLYTKGREITNLSGSVIGVENTALSDMVEFVNFLGSGYFLDYTDTLDITISYEGNIQDTTSLLSGSDYQFRATVEFAIHYTQEAIGYAGILDGSSIQYIEADGEVDGEEDDKVDDGVDDGVDDKVDDEVDGEVYIDPSFTPNPSGGGTESLATECLGFFTGAEIESDE